MTQRTLFDGEHFERERARFQRWLTFHRKNPVVFDLFRRYANEAINAGRERFGARLIGERIRWYTQIETTDCDFKINDHHWPYYARLLMLMDDRFEAVFERRDSRFDVDDDTLLREAMVAGSGTTG